MYIGGGGMGLDKCLVCELLRVKLLLGEGPEGAHNFEFSTGGNNGLLTPIQPPWGTIGITAHLK